MALTEADMSMTRLAEEGQNDRNFGDEKLLVRFHVEPRQNQLKTEEEGRPIYDDVVYITIRVPGNKQSVIIRPARAKDKLRFAEHWRLYEQKGVEEYVSGTPLEAWPALSTSQIRELEYFNVRTVEQLAGMNDSDAQGFMGMNLLKTKAKTFLEAAAGGAPLEKLQAQLDEMQNARDTDRVAMEDQAKRIQELEAELED